MVKRILLSYPARTIIGVFLGGVLGIVLVFLLVPQKPSPPLPPQPAITGSYSTSGLSGEGCKHTGPGWILTPPETVAKTYHVKDAYYCAQTTGAAIIPVTGHPFSLLVPFTFSKTDPKK